MLKIALIALLLSTGSALSQEASRHSDTSTQPPASNQRGSDAVPFVIKILPAPSSEAKSDDEKKERSNKSIIDEKVAFETQRIADYTDRLAVFTFLLFVVGIVQAGMFFGQLRLIRDDSKLARDTALHYRRVERAYVSGGGAPSSQDPGKFVLAVNNHGKTPAEFLEYGFGWCEADAIPNFPTYKWKHWRDRYGAGTQSHGIALVKIPTDLKRPAIYGRYRYRDIFGDFHSDAFIQEGGTPIIAPQPFTISDPDWDLPPKAKWESLVASETKPQG